ncbi:MAG: ABC transporter substrate-binding protein, partial [Chloroflexota bacterium]|nr:ABC transporter substrate-binding protein [Chloroflexota bacterium]
MRRTKWNALAFLFSGALILAACGQQPGESPGESEPTGSQPAGSQPATGGEGTGTITYAIDGQLTTLSNANNDVPTAEAFNDFIGAALYEHDVGLTPVPDLAADLCDVSEDDLVWTCTLTDATFHNGDPVTAGDVAFTYQLAQSENCRFNPSVCLAPFLESATAIDDTTVEFTLLEPYAPFATVILPGIAIDSEAVVTAAFEDFAGEAQGADPAAVTEAMDALNAAAEPEEGDPDPAACEAAIAAGEAAIESAGVEVPSADEFNTGGENADEYDPCAHATALADLLSQILATIEEEGVDAIAAVYPLLSFNSEPVNAGPYMCEPGCFAPGESLTLTAFPDYHAGAPATETIVMPIITDEVQIANAVQAGQVDWHYSVPSDAYSALEGDPNVKFAEYPDFGYFSLQYNLREGQLFHDLGARKAVQYCIDKAATVEQATNGQGIPIEADIPPASWAFNPNLETVERDVAAAIGYLEEAGWTVETDADGVATGPATRGDETFSTQVYVRAGQPERIRFMELLRDQVAECGIEIEVIEGDFATVLLPLLTYPHIPPNADEPYDAYFGGWSTGFDPDPFALFHSSQCTTEEQPELYNYICWQNAEADALIDEGLVVSDQEERAAIYQEFEQIVYDEQPYLFAWSDLAREVIDVNMQSTAGELE